MKYQNFKSDFTSVHTFYKQNGDTKIQIAVPEHVRLTFFTAERCGKIVVERNGTEMNGCTLSADGMTLSANIPLSRKSLGIGELLCEIAEITSEAGFPDSERVEVTPVKLGVTLWPGKSGDSLDVSQDSIGAISSKKKVTWAELKSLREKGMLSAGQLYRITDFVTTSAQAETRSAGHAFDIIVVADDEKTLNEDARAVLHEGDTYFKNNQLEAWELKYSLDNDTTRFTWADSKNGKGVVWWMKDEFNNECFYDFKNIQYKRYKVTSTHANTADLVSQMPYLGLPSNNSKGLSESDFSDFKYVYTFTKYASDGAVIEDASLIGVSVKDTYGCHSNHIGAFFSTEEVSKDVYANIRSLNNGVFYTNDGNNILCYGNTIGTGCYKFTCLHGMYESSCGNGCSSWTCGKGCHNWTCGDFCHGWTTGTDCSYWTCGNNCHSWSCGAQCRHWSCGNNCHSWSCGNLCDVWICGNNCHNWTCGDSCHGWSCGNSCYNWTCGDSCHGWSCGNSCYGWTCGNKGIAWSCGDQCYDWTCGDECNTWKCGNFCHSWKCGNTCNSWTCGNNSYSWTCGDNCRSWNCGNSCSGWTCGDYCIDWTCGHNCDNWTCEENCTNWVCGNGCDNWSCKKQCNSWVCGNECSEWKCDEFCSNWTCGDYCSNWKCDGWCGSWKCGNDSSGWYAGGASAFWTCGNGCNNWKCGGNCQTWECGNGCSHWEVNVAQRGFRIESGVSGSKEQPLLIWIDGENKSETRKLIITTKRTEGASTSDDLVMYFADELILLKDKVDCSEAGLSEAINTLSTGTATPEDADYFISQYAGGGTTHTTYHRRPFSALWTWIKGKVEALGYTTKTYVDSKMTWSTFE